MPRENWNRDADREVKRRERFIITENKNKLLQLQRAREKEIRTWTRGADRELKRRDKFMERQQAKKTKVRERAEAKKWNKEIRAEEKRRPPAFNVVRTYSNADARFTTYFDTYKIYVYDSVDPVVVFKKALDLTVEGRGLRPGDMIRIIVSHPSWIKPFSTKLIRITNDERFFFIPF